MCLLYRDSFYQLLAYINQCVSMKAVALIERFDINHVPLRKIPLIIKFYQHIPYVKNSFIT